MADLGLDTSSARDNEDTAGLVRRYARRMIAVALGVALVDVVLLGVAFLSDSPLSIASMATLVVITVCVGVFAAVGARPIIDAVEALEHDQAILQQLYDRARIDSLLDPLTGLGNHRAFQEELERYLDEAHRYERRFALALMDVDDLKRVNDERGHAAGDALLASMGRIVVHSTRSVDRAFRVGGDEFAILMPEADASDALVVCRRILATAVAASERRSDQPFSFSAGISAVPHPCGDGRRLYDEADAALYWAKRHGRTDIEVFDSHRHGASGDDRPVAELGAAVGRIVERRLIRPAYQAIVDLSSGRAIGFEGLVRPRGSEFRDVTSMFQAAEAADRSVELDLACLESVASGASRMAGDAYLSVNLSPLTLEARMFRPGDIATILARTGISPSRIVVEVTERERVQDFEQLRRNLEGCRELGMRIAIDDVGAGYAGLRLLSEIRFDVVKLDMSVVQGGVHRTTSLAVIRALQDFVRQSRSALVAEGIETGAQLDLVRELGIQAGQGYLLSRPAPEPTSVDLDLDALASAFSTVHADGVGAA